MELLSCSSLLPSRCSYATQDSILANKKSFHFPQTRAPNPRPMRSLKIMNCYVAESGASIGDMTEKIGSGSKVLIPGLADELHGKNGSLISSGVWEWKPKFNVHYETAGSENVNAPAVLFLPGFGVGSFHYEKQLRDLGREYRVWALDFLGQGRSLPFEDPAPRGKSVKAGLEDMDIWGFGEEPEPWAEELAYSIDLWQEQVSHFIDQVIGEPVYVVGNSLGGFVALYLAARNREIAKGVTLLNATPFWGLLPNPVTSPRLAKLFPWAGTFPLPPTIQKLTEIVWQKISDPRTIRDVLKQVYVDHSINVDKVFSTIVEVTQHPAAPASFASIMFSPRAELSFQEALIRCREQDVPICLMYGKEDPWVRPIWGLQVKRQVPHAPYYEISPAGHCPHDEVPEVVNYLLRGWIKNLESDGRVALPLVEGIEDIEQGLSKELEFIKDGSRKSVKVNVRGSKLSLWKPIRSFVKSRLPSSGLPSL
ncbi:pheophytinase [Wolffia australiana]